MFPIGNNYSSWANTSINIYNFNLNIGGASQVDATQALQLLQSQFVQSSLQGSAFFGNMQIPMCGCMPPPRMDLSSAPSGRGLQTNESGWPAGTVTTAGGYHVVPQGNTNWAIFGPGQSAKDTPNTRVWGDPHVNEKDGTRWDFTGTKGTDGQTGNDFVLPDGTRIFARTSGDSGHPVTTGLEIANGTDHVSIDGVNGSPKTGAIQQDGYEWRAQHVAGAGDRASFFLTGDNDNQTWVRQTHGRMDGAITGTKNVNGSYDQEIDANNMGLATQRPSPFTPAWGNMMRGRIDDMLSQYGLNASSMIHLNDLQNRFQFGGWGSYFPSMQTPMDMLSGLRELLVSDNEYRRNLQFGFAQNTTRFV